VSDLTNTPKREPAYGKAAERYSKEQRLGAAVLMILRVPAAEMDDDCEGITGLDARHLAAVARAARALGLLPEARP